MIILASIWAWTRRGSPPVEEAPQAEDRRAITSLAVLPLLNLTGDPEQEYFADGITVALITDLSKIGALKVISLTSAMRYKGTDKPISQIAAELGVDALVEGSVIREGDQVGITAQLVVAETEESLWADRYERDLTSILKLQAEIAQSIAAEIQVALTPEEQSLLAASREVDPAAYEAYLKRHVPPPEIHTSGLRSRLAVFRVRPRDRSGIRSRPHRGRQRLDLHQSARGDPTIRGDTQRSTGPGSGSRARPLASRCPSGAGASVDGLGQGLGGGR